jgi:hypothetical protein
MGTVLLFKGHGRGTFFGQGTSGQFSENQTRVRSSLPTVIPTLPHSIAGNRLESLRARELTWDNLNPSAFRYVLATVRSCSMADMGGMSVILRSKSMGILPRAPEFPIGYSTDMDNLSKLYEAIKRHKANTGTSFAQIERQAKVRNGAVGNLRRAVENNGPKPKIATLQALADVVGSNGADNDLNDATLAEWEAELEEKLRGIRAVRDMLREKRADPSYSPARGLRDRSKMAPG